MKNQIMGRAFFRNRYTITLGSIAILAAGWNLYVGLNSGGLITGRVVGPDDRPVAKATILLSEKTLLVSAARGRTASAANGTFRFTGHNLYRLSLEAFKEGVGTMPPKEFHLYFKGQNLFLDQPLRLQAPK